MSKKYLICPGYIASKTDGDRHFIGFNTLIKLYKVNRHECINGSSLNNLQIAHSNLILLGPKYEGNYDV